MPHSVQCPRCQAAVSVSDDAGGSRVDCPSCNQTFIVPGFAGGTGYAAGGSSSTGTGTNAGFEAPTKPVASASNNNNNNDDDWLGDDFPQLAPVTPKSSPSTAPDESAGFGKPASNVADVDDDDLMAAAPFDSVEVIDDDIAASMEEPEKKKPVYASEFKVRCPHCGTQTEVKAAKAGQEIKCRDCHTWVRVGQAPRVRPKAEMNMDTAPTFQFSPSEAASGDRPSDPFRKSADELLAKASKVEDDEPKPDMDVPRIRDWALAVFGIFAQIGVMAHWLIMSTLASVIAFFALAIGHPILIVGLFAGGGMFAAVVLACGFAIMQSVANEEEAVTDWPVTLEPAEWLAPTAFCIAAASLACFPGWFIGYMSFGAGIVTVCFMMMSVFTVFPFALLSMLDMQNIFVPFSPDVGRSVTRCEEAWGGFYFSSGLIFFVTFLIFVFADGLAPPATAVLSIFFGVGASFIYFAMLGRLAYAIGQTTNAKPKENNIAEIRDAERRENEV